MLYQKDGEFKLMPFVATFRQHGEEHEQHVVNKRDLESYEKAGHITELEFEEAEYDQEIVDRLNEVKDYPESEFQTVNDYVFEGKVTKGTSLYATKQNELLEESLLELTALMTGGN